VVVNGRRCPALAGTLEQLAGRAAEFAPSELSFPVHGDLNLGNVLLRHHPGGALTGFTVLDPRGTTDDWDPVYDVAKCLFSLTSFEAALAGGFSVQRFGGTPVRYRVALRRPWPGHQAAAARFSDVLDRVPFFAELHRTDPQWRTRLVVAHAVHHLAEAACRLSDRTPRDLGPVAGWAACIELARGLLLTGLLLLADAEVTGWR
jgi:hypothetical protein